MQYLNSRPYLFRRQSARRRIGQLMIALSALTAINASLMAAQASAQDKAFGKLVERPGLVGASLADSGKGRFGVVGGNEKFEFTRDGRSGTIRFLCDAGNSGCTEAMRSAQPLMAEPGGRGDMVFKSAGGMVVLRVTATGGGTLFGGAPFVPTSVPKSGRAVVPL